MRIAVWMIVMLAALPARADQVDGRLIGGLAALVVAAGATGAATYAAIRVNHLNGDDGYQAYRANVSFDQDACETARSGVEFAPPAAPPTEVASLCDEGRALTIVQAVLFPVAILSGGASAYLLSTSPTVSEKEKAVHIRPQVGHERAGVALSVSF